MNWRSSYLVQDRRMVEKCDKMTDGHKIVTGCIKAGEENPVCDDRKRKVVRVTKSVRHPEKHEKIKDLAGKKKQRFQSSSFNEQVCKTLTDAAPSRFRTVLLSHKQKNLLAVQQRQAVSWPHPPNPAVRASLQTQQKRESHTQTHTLSWMEMSGEFTEPSADCCVHRPAPHVTFHHTWMQPCLGLWSEQP